MMLIVDMKNLQAKRNGKKIELATYVWRGGMWEQWWLCIHVVHKGHPLYIYSVHKCRALCSRSVAYRLVGHTNREPEQPHERLCMYVNENCEMQMTIIIMTERRLVCSNNFNFTLKRQRQRCIPALWDFAKKCKWMSSLRRIQENSFCVLEHFYS